MKTEPINTSRTWGYQELALRYFPNNTPQSATNQLSRWIRFSAELTEQLHACHWRPGRRVLTPRQAECIINHLGEP